MRLFKKKRLAKAPGPRKNMWKDPQGERATKEAGRMRAEKRSTLVRWAKVVTSTMCATALIGIGVTYSGPALQELLEIKTISVEGVYQLEKQQVLDLAKVKPGVPLHHIVTTAIQKQVEAHPWVKTAEVTRLPFHELRISVSERKPAVIVRAESQNFLCDEDGHVLNRLGQLDNEALPLVTGIGLSGLVQGTESVRHAVVSGIELARVVGQSFEGRLHVLADNPSNLVALVQGMRFQFGDEALQEQWERFRRVKLTLKARNSDGLGRNVREVDLRYENRIIVREGG
ncbi:MAG: FtsQ-type POTRA domain-containing protein [Nitrospira sp.]|nr:FtsQ-type POTRA domain-containing protein [Nitrospira sp.]